jgi:hypothetical protein
LNARKGVARHSNGYVDPVGVLALAVGNMAPLRDLLALNGVPRLAARCFGADGDSDDRIQLPSVGSI